MNDFLQSLRSNKDKRFTRGRRSYDGNHNHNHNHYGNANGNVHPNHVNGNERRSKGPRPGVDALFTEENVATFTKLLEGLNENQKAMVKAKERRAQAEERKAGALEEIAIYLQKLTGSESARVASPAAEAVAEAVTAVVAPAPVEAAPVEAAPVEAAPIEEVPAEQAQVEAAVSAEPVATEAEQMDLDLEEKRNAAPKKAPKKADAPKAGKPGVDAKAEIVRIVNEMRDAGATYDTIASRLTEEGFKTFSGRGKWHAQTIHRLCGGKKKS